MKKNTHPIGTARVQATGPVSMSSVEMHMLDRSRSDLQHLIYWMEHDPSLQAQAEKIASLKSLLLNIEDSIGSRPIGKPQPPIGRYHRN